MILGINEETTMTIRFQYGMWWSYVKDVDANTIKAFSSHVRLDAMTAAIAFITELYGPLPS